MGFFQETTLELLPFSSLLTHYIQSGCPFSMYFPFVRNNFFVDKIMNHRSNVIVKNKALKHLALGTDSSEHKKFLSAYYVSWTDFLIL